MITRDIHQTQVMPVFTHAARFAGCGAGTLNFTCTTAGGIEAAGATGLGSCAVYFPGMIVDRHGLRRRFNSLLVAPMVYGDANTSDELTRRYGKFLSVGLQHTCTTGGTFADYSTEDWLIHEPLWRQTTATSTMGFATAVQRGIADVYGGIMTSTTATSTSLGIEQEAGRTQGDPSTSTGIVYYAGAGARFDLGGAKRYLRTLFRLEVMGTACGELGVEMHGVGVFGEADESPVAAPVARILVTTPCAT